MLLYVNYISMKLEKRVQHSQIVIESSKSNFIFLDYGTPLYSSTNSHSILTVSVINITSTWILCCPAFSALPLESYTSLIHLLQPWSCDFSAIEIWEKVMCMYTFGENFRSHMEPSSLFSKQKSSSVTTWTTLWVWVLNEGKLKLS